MTTTELIKILQDHEKGGISHKSREISLTINGRYMINPQIEVSGTGDGICGPEIDLDICGKWLEAESADGKSDVLDKIRSDIEKLANDEWNTKVGSVSQGLECALEIIEAYQEGR